MWMICHFFLLGILLINPSGSFSKGKPLFIIISVALISIVIDPSTGHTAWHKAHPVHKSSIIVGNVLKLSNFIA